MNEKRKAAEAFGGYSYNHGSWHIPKPVLRQPVCVQQLLYTTIVGKDQTYWDIQLPHFVTNTEFKEGLAQNLIAKRLPQREIMGHDFDDAMVHWRLVGRNTSWAGQFSSQERNQEPRL